MSIIDRSKLKNNIQMMAGGHLLLFILEWVFAIDRYTVNHILMGINFFMMIFGYSLIMCCYDKM